MARRTIILLPSTPTDSKAVGNYLNITISRTAIEEVLRQVLLVGNLTHAHAENACLGKVRITGWGASPHMA